MQNESLQTYLNKDVLSVSVIIFSLSAILIHLSLWPSLWRRVYFALFVEGDMGGGGGDLNSATPQKKFTITAGKVDETLPPQNLFLAT